MTLTKNSQLKKSVFVIKNDRGLHTRPAAELVKCASRFRCQIFLEYKNLRVNAKSILGVLMLAASKGAKVTIEAEGCDAEEAVDQLLTLSSQKFHVKY